MVTIIWRFLIPYIENRRAVYPAQYNAEAITKEEINTILETANWAPTHRRTEPWRFKVFHSKESRENLGVFLSNTYREETEKYSELKFNKYRSKPLKAACMIAICYQRDPKESVPEWEEIAATAMAVQNMWLTASQMSIGSYWSSPPISKLLYNHIAMEKGEHCLGFFYLGKYDEDLPEGHRISSIHEKTEWV